MPSLNVQIVVGSTRFTIGQTPSDIPKNGDAETAACNGQLGRITNKLFRKVWVFTTIKIPLIEIKKFNN